MSEKADNKFGDLTDLVKKAPPQKKDTKGNVKLSEKQVVFKLREDWHKKLKILSIKQGTSLKDLLYQAIEKEYFSK